MENTQDTYWYVHDLTVSAIMPEGRSYFASVNVKPQFASSYANIQVVSELRELEESEMNSKRLILMGRPTNYSRTVKTYQVNQEIADILAETTKEVYESYDVQPTTDDLDIPNTKQQNDMLFEIQEGWEAFKVAKMGSIRAFTRQRLSKRSGVVPIDGTYPHSKIVSEFFKNNRYDATILDSAYRNLILWKSDNGV